MHRVWDGAVRLLGDVGLEIPNDEVARRLAGEAIFRDGRAAFAAEVVEPFAEEVRQAGSAPR